MNRRNGSGPNKDEQIEQFIQTARELGCDESEEGFAAKLKAIASVKPMTNAEVQKKAKCTRKLRKP